MQSSMSIREWSTTAVKTEWAVKSMRQARYFYLQVTPDLRPSKNSDYSLLRSQTQQTDYCLGIADETYDAPAHIFRNAKPWRYLLKYPAVIAVLSSPSTLAANIRTTKEIVPYPSCVHPDSPTPSCFTSLLKHPQKWFFKVRMMV